MKNKKNSTLTLSIHEETTDHQMVHHIQKSAPHTTICRHDISGTWGREGGGQKKSMFIVVIINRLI